MFQKNRNSLRSGLAVLSLSLERSASLHHPTGFVSRNKGKMCRTGSWNISSLDIVVYYDTFCRNVVFLGGTSYLETFSQPSPFVFVSFIYFRPRSAHTLEYWSDLPGIIIHLSPLDFVFRNFLKSYEKRGSLFSSEVCNIISFFFEIVERKNNQNNLLFSAPSCGKIMINTKAGKVWAVEHKLEFGSSNALTHFPPPRYYSIFVIYLFVSFEMKNKKEQELVWNYKRLFGFSPVLLSHTKVFNDSSNSNIQQGDFVWDSREIIMHKKMMWMESLAVKWKKQYKYSRHLIPLYKETGESIL